MGQILENKKKATKRTHESHTGQKTAKTCKKHQECCGNNYSRVITDYENPNKIKMLRKMETPQAQEIYKKRSKTAEQPFGNIKQNLKVTEFNTTGLKRTQTEAKLLAISHNLKRIYNETIQKELIPPTKQTKYLKIIKLMPKNFKKIINFESPSFFKI